MDISFSRNLIIGRIVETIFEEMFRKSDEFTILPIGYERTTPELAQYQHHVHIKKVLDNIRNAPDFALISQDKSRVFLVEVKYRNIIETQEVLTTAKNILEKWNPSWLFIATKDMFYLSSCSDVIDRNGNIEPMSYTWINEEAQKNYLTLIKEFI